MGAHSALILKRMREFREKAGITQAELEERLILGPGWIDRFESGRSIPSFDTLLAIAASIGVPLQELVTGLSMDELAQSIDRSIYATQANDDLEVHFSYASFDATYRLRSATVAEYDDVIKVLRDGLAKTVAGSAASDPESASLTAVKSRAVADSFLKAVEFWPHANPSDLWWFIISRAFCERFNHPAVQARLDLGQSWKRTGGWALEEVIARYYQPALERHGLNMVIATGDRKARLVNQLKTRERIEADKVDVFLTSGKDEAEQCFGVVHVKASFAERRTDDVPLSRALIEAGYTSILCTMDAKSSPSVDPVNRGELGVVLTGASDRRSAKRKDIEDDGYFSACFSYNTNTRPTPSQQAAKARIYVCDFNDPNDSLVEFVIAAHGRFEASRPQGASAPIP